MHSIVTMIMQTLFHCAEVCTTKGKCGKGKLDKYAEKRLEMRLLFGGCYAARHWAKSCHMPAHIKWHVVVVAVATTCWQQRGHMCGIMRTLRQGKSCMQPVLTANQFICLRDATAICPATHTLTFPCPSNTPHSPLQSEEIHHQNAAPLLFRAVNCKYDSGVRLRALCRNGRCPAVGALSFSLSPPSYTPVRDKWSQFDCAVSRIKRKLF